MSVREQGSSGRNPHILRAAGLAALGCAACLFAGRAPSQGEAQAPRQQAGDRSDDGANTSPWKAYGERYAIIVMGGRAAPASRHYGWYWNDTFKMYTALKDRGFVDEHICFLTYGPNVKAHAKAVDGLSTVQNIRAAYKWVSQHSTTDDLLYIYWVDHGNHRAFEAHDGLISHAELGRLTKAIKAKQIIGAYNPCFSGAVIDDLSRKGVITITSQNARSGNAWGWAGKWRRALKGGTEENPSDANRDGHVSFSEAYAWIAPQSQAAGEHSMYDDNGDGKGSEWGNPSFDPDNQKKDGYQGARYSLDGWLEKPVQPDSPDLTSGNLPQS